MTLAWSGQSAEVRRRRADLKADLAEGRTPIGLVLMNPPTYALRMELGHLLRATPQMGRSRMNRTCRRAGVLPTQHLEELSLEDRRRLICALPKPVVRASVGAT